MEPPNVSDLAELPRPTFNLLANREADRDRPPSHVIMCRAEPGPAIVITLDPEIGAADAAKICEILSRGVTDVHVQPGVRSTVH
jgi:hypothetical protein